jgi:hypothetical protein
MGCVRIIGRNLNELKIRRLEGKKSSSAALINHAKSTALSDCQQGFQAG